MADQICGGYLMIGSTDLSAFLRSHNPVLKKDEVENTKLSSTAHEFILGLENNEYQAELTNDQAGTVWAALLAMHTSSTYTALKIRMQNAAISSTNPELQINSILSTLPMAAGEPGSLSVFNITFRPVGAATLDTTP